MATAADYKHPILASMARTLFVLAWGDFEEQEGRSYPGQDLFDVAPDYTPMGAKLKAEDIARSIAKANGLEGGEGGVTACLEHLYAQAIGADEESGQDVSAAKSDRGTFGHYLVMQALGHGVSWFDDHAEFSVLNDKPYESPHCEGCTMYKGDDGQPYLDFYLSHAA